MRPFRDIVAVAAVVAVLASVCTAGTEARASQPRSDTEDTVQIDAIFGFSRVAPGNGWSPITVLVTAADEPIAGTVSIQTAGAAGPTLQAASFAAAAGSTVRVPMAARPTWYERRLEITARDERGTLLAQRVYASAPSANEGRLPPFWSGDDMVLSAAPGFPGEQLADALPANHDPQGRGRPFAAVQPADLPIHEAAYDRVAIVIVDRETVARADPRAVAALRRWLHAGGRVLVVAEQVGDAWSTWLAGSAVEGAVSFDDPSGAASDDSGPVRAPRLGPVARSAGWRLGWADADGVPRLAEGPVGFGWLTVLGASPRVTPMLPWEAGDDSEDSPPNPLAPIVEGWSFSWPSVATDPWLLSLRDNHRRWVPYGGDAAIAARLDAIAGETSAGVGSMLLLALLPLSLGFLLGPIDFIVLGRLKRRHLAWLTAAIWVGVLSVVAGALPGLMLGSESRIASLTTVDAVLPNQALPVSDPRHAAAVPGEAPSAYASGVTVLFAGQQNVFALGQGSSIPARWHTLDDQVGTGSVVTAPTVFAQSPASSDAWQSRAIRPVALPTRAWSITLLRDEGPADLGISAALRIDGDEPVLELIGGPEGARVLAGELVIGERSLPIEAAGPLDSEHRFAESGTTAPLVLRRDRRLALAAAMLASAPTARGDARAARIEAGWASVTLLVEGVGAADRFEARGDAVRQDAALWRLMIPLHEPSNSEPTP